MEGGQRRSRSFHRDRAPVLSEVMRAVGNTVTLAIAAAMIGFTLGLLFGLIAGYFPRYLDRQGCYLDRDRRRLGAALLARMVLVIIFSVQLKLAACRRRRPWRLRRMGMGLGTHPLSDPARDHHLGYSDGDVHPHRARR